MENCTSFLNASVFVMAFKSDLFYSQKSVASTLNESEMKIYKEKYKVDLKSVPRIAKASFDLNGSNLKGF